jgi:hypothetical protein
MIVIADLSPDALSIVVNVCVLFLTSFFYLTQRVQAAFGSTWASVAAYFFCFCSFQSEPAVSFAQRKTPLDVLVHLTRPEVEFHKVHFTNDNLQ